MNRASVQSFASISHIKLNRLKPEKGSPELALNGRECPGGATHGFCQMELPASIKATMRSAASLYRLLVICSIVFLAGAARVSGSG